MLILQGKRNTSRAVFTSHERALAKANWSSSSARLNRDSFLPFGSCGLCLEIVRDPVACQLGDIFCRECALANLLAQKKEIKRADKSRHGAQQEAARAKAAEDDEDTKRAVLTFEKTQAGLTDVKKRGISDQDDGAGRETLPAATGTKRKFALDEDELLRIAKADKAKARKAIDDEKVIFLVSQHVVHASSSLLLNKADQFFTPGCQADASFILDAITHTRCTR